MRPNQSQDYRKIVKRAERAARHAVPHLSVTDMCDLLSTPPRNLNRAFQAVHGCPPFRFFRMAAIRRCQKGAYEGEKWRDRIANCATFRIYRIREVRGSIPGAIWRTPLGDACEGFGVWQVFATSAPVSSTRTRAYAALNLALQFSVPVHRDERELEQGWRCRNLKNSYAIPRVRGNFELGPTVFGRDPGQRFCAGWLASVRRTSCKRKTGHRCVMTTRSWPHIETGDQLPPLA